MSYKSCPKCRKITKHETGPMDGGGRRMFVCQVCGGKRSVLSSRQAAEIEKRRAERFPEEEKFFNQVSEKVEIQRINVQSEES